MNIRVDTDGCRQSLDIDGWIRVGTPFENGVADVTGCSQIGVVPFYDVNTTKLCTGNKEHNMKLHLMPLCMWQKFPMNGELLAP